MKMCANSLGPERLDSHGHAAGDSSDRLRIGIEDSQDRFADVRFALLVEVCDVLSDVDKRFCRNRRIFRNAIDP